MPTALYTIRVNGRLGSTTLSAFPEFDSDLLDGDTLLTGRVTDRSALYGVLGRLESLGLELIDVHRLDDPGPGDCDHPIEVTRAHPTRPEPGAGHTVTDTFRRPR